MKGDEMTGYHIFLIAFALFTFLGSSWAMLWNPTRMLLLGLFIVVALILFWED